MTAFHVGAAEFCTGVEQDKPVDEAGLLCRGCYGIHEHVGLSSSQHSKERIFKRGDVIGSTGSSCYILIA